MLLQVHRTRIEGPRRLPVVWLLATLALLGGGANPAAAEPPAPAPQAPAATAADPGPPRGLPEAAATDRAAALAMEDALTLDEAEAAQRHAGPSPGMYLRAQAAEARFAAALAAAPGDAALAGDANAFYSRWGHLLLAVDRAMLAVIEGAPDPALLAIRLGGRPPADFHQHSVELFTAALAVRPEAAVLWAYAADASSWREWRAAFLERSLACLAPRGQVAAGWSC